MAVALKSFHLQQNTQHASPHYYSYYFLIRNQNPIHIHRYSPISNTSSYQLLFFIFSSSTWRPIHICEARKMGTNTGFFSFKGDGDGDEEDDDVDDTDESVDQWFDVLEDYIDSIWILKVFGSYGLMLPAIISSLLLITGPKTFLMALAIPLAQSTLSFAVQRTLNKDNKKRKTTKTKTKKGRRSPAYSSRKVRLEQDERIGVQSSRKRKKLYPFFRVQKNDNSSDSSDCKGASHFGGWDELDNGGIDSFSEYYSVREVQKLDELQVRDAENGNSERWIEKDGPLLLRLLVSFFPFLSSWTSLL